MCRVEMLVVLLMLCLSQQTTADFSQILKHREARRSGQQLRCTASSKPCRMKATMQITDSSSDAAPPETVQIETRELCGCSPVSGHCSHDWEGNSNHTIVRELRTDGRLIMTFSMMFCEALRPDLRGGWCSSNDIALQLIGQGPSYVATQLDFLHCNCIDPRPLVLHRSTQGDHFQRYDAFVCANHKRRCNVDLFPDTCLVYNDATGVTDYPCKCPMGTVCTPVPSRNPRHFYQDHRCMAMTLNP